MEELNKIIELLKEAPSTNNVEEYRKHILHKVKDMRWHHVAEMHNYIKNNKMIMATVNSIMHRED